MPRFDIEAHGSDEGSGSRPARAGSFDKVERFVLVGALWSLAFCLLGGGPGKSAADTEESGRPGLEIVRGAAVQEIEPAVYDPAKEIRVTVAERTQDDRLDPILLRLRGPWSFGVSEMGSTAGLLGEPSERGAGYLLYNYAEGKIRLTLLFNAGRLDTVVLEPNRCLAGTDKCTTPYAWSWTQDQMAQLPLTSNEVESGNCSLLAAAQSSTYFLACSSPEKPSALEIEAVYVQRLTKEIRNPVFIRGLMAANEEQIEQRRSSLTQAQYARLLSHFEWSILLKQRELGTDHSSLQFLRFEMGRVQQEAGRSSEGRKVMLSAANGLAGGLGSDHPDIVAMRSWLQMPVVGGKLR